MPMQNFDINQLIYEKSHDNDDKNNFPGKRYMTYEEALALIKDLICLNHSKELSALVEDKQAESTVKALIKRYIHEKLIIVRDYPDLYKLIDQIYDDMAGFAFLSKYIYNDEIEEINANSWNDIEVVTAKGWQKLDEQFISPEQSVDIAKKMAKLGGVIVDGSCPAADSYITKGVRISVLIPPVVDEENGAAFSIRKQRVGNFTMDELVDMGTATRDELELLILFIQNGISVGIAGATGSGKTTDIEFFIKNIPDHLRIFSIEDTRELSLQRFNKEGKIVNRVVQAKTRPSEIERNNITTEVLLKRALRFNPDIIIPAEMRGEEAQIAQEAGRTGHTIITSLHATTALAAYTRILTMCMSSGTRLSEDIMIRLIIEAFPVMVFKKQLADKTRKYMRIIEAEDYRNGKIVGRTLYKFVVTGRELTEDGKRIKRIIGSHVRVSPISNSLANRLLENGADINIIKKYASDKWMPGEYGGEDDQIFDALP